jgi:hypothetical protein
MDTHTVNTHTMNTHTMNPAAPALLRYAITGLLATIESYRVGALPLHRFAWELRTRMDLLAVLLPPARTLTRMRWLHRTVELLHAELTAGGRTALTGDEHSTLAATLTTLTTMLHTLTPPNPPRPATSAGARGHRIAG